MALPPEVLASLQGPRGTKGGPAWYDHITAPDPVFKEIEGLLNTHARDWAEDQKCYPPPRPEKLSSESIHSILLLPVKDGKVVDSFAASQGNVQPDRLAPYTVPGLATIPVSTLKALLALPQGKPIRGQAPGDDLILWKMAARFVRDLLVQGEYLPGVLEGRASWIPALDFPEHQRRFQALVNAMPAVCRAGAGRSGRLPDPEEYLKDFIVTLLDTCVNSFNETPLGALGSSSPWVTALYSDRQDGRISVWNATESFQEGWDDWVHSVRGQNAGGMARTMLRLEQPENAEARPDGIIEGYGWKVTFHLQSVQDESLIVSARDVWSTNSRTLRKLDQRFDSPQERLLADLARAAQIFPPLRRGLDESRPEGVELVASEVRELVAEKAAQLREAGFGIVLPAWDKVHAQTGGGIKLHMRIKPKGGAPLAGQNLSMASVGLDAMCDFKWEISLGGKDIGLDEFRRLVRLKIPVVEHRGQWVVFDPEAAAKTLDFLDGPGSEGQATLGSLMRNSLGLEPAGLPGMGSDEEAIKPVVEVGETRAEDWLKDVFDRLQSGGTAGRCETGKYFVGKLRPYQSQGLAWLRFLDSFGLGGCLADDMGLGKTVQVLAMLAGDLEAAMSGEAVGPTLLVCPTSVMGNWQREARRFVPNLRVRLRHGPGRLHGESFVRDAERMHLVIVSYGLADRDREELSQVKWRRVILDEAQNIKNPTTKQHKAVKSLPAQTRFALTGTPVENRLTELWSIFDFLIPGHLGTSISFTKRFAKPITTERDPEAAKLLRRLTGPFLLRRVKTDPKVAGDLPEKQENKVFCSLTREQATLYQAVVDQMSQEISQDPSGSKGMVLNTLLRLKQICNHPTLFMGDKSEGAAARSGKLQRLTEMVEELVEEGEKALIFTQFKEMGDLLVKHLKASLKVEVPFLHGGVAREARDAMVDKFQTGGAKGPPVMVLSLKAGGTGLNLTTASHVFHFDRWWNPAVEDQATDRAFRIGQTKNVLVHKFVCQGTVEELIDTMIASKKDLAERIVGSGEDWIAGLSVDELKDAFALREDAVDDDE